MDGMVTQKLLEVVQEPVSMDAYNASDSVLPTC